MVKRDNISKKKKTALLWRFPRPSIVIVIFFFISRKLLDFKTKI